MDRPAKRIKTEHTDSDDEQESGCEYEIIEMDDEILPDELSSNHHEQSSNLGESFDEYDIDINSTENEMIVKSEPEFYDYNEQTASSSEMSQSQDLSSISSTTGNESIRRRNQRTNI